MSENANDTTVKQTTKNQSNKDIQQVITPKSTGRKKKLPLFIGIAAFFVIGILVTLSLTIFGGGSKIKKVLAQLNLGNKYLDELDFERAEAAFTAALQIDPKNVDAYLGLIDVYANQEDAKELVNVYKQAKKELQKGSADDQEKLEMLQKKEIFELEKLIQIELIVEDYDNAKQLADYLAKVDKSESEELNRQIAETKEEAKRLASEAEERRAALAKEMVGVGTGEIITFGHYEQDNIVTNGAEPIDWVVLTKEEDRMLLVSAYGLDVSSSVGYGEEASWEKCDLRNWLIETFFNKAFDEAEKEEILTVRNANPNVYSFFNSEYGRDVAKEYEYYYRMIAGDGTAGIENETSDRVFCLSYEEVFAYFSSDDARRCMPTLYAKAQGTLLQNDQQCGHWWLRTTIIDSEVGMSICDDGRLGALPTDCAPGLVRPAIWLSTSERTEDKKTLAERKMAEEEKAKEEAKEREAERAKEIEGVGTGEIVTFGCYEQDNDMQTVRSQLIGSCLQKKRDACFSLAVLRWIASRMKRG